MSNQLRLPCLSNCWQHQSKNWIVMSLTGRPVTNRSHICSRMGSSMVPFCQRTRISSKRFGIGIAPLPRLLDQTYRVLLILPGMETWQGKSAPPDLVKEANGPIRQSGGILHLNSHVPLIESKSESKTAQQTSKKLDKNGQK